MRVLLCCSLTWTLQLDTECGATMSFSISVLTLDTSLHLADNWWQVTDWWVECYLLLFHHQSAARLPRSAAAPSEDDLQYFAIVKSTRIICIVVCIYFKSGQYILSYNTKMNTSFRICKISFEIVIISWTSRVMVPFNLVFSTMICMICFLSCLKGLLFYKT